MPFNIQQKRNFMKKRFIITSLLIAGMLGCSEDSTVNSTVANLTKTNKTDEIGYAKAQGDSLFPYFEFNENGTRTRYPQGTHTLAKKSGQRDELILNSIEDFATLEASISKKLSTDSDYNHSIERPLDYVCRPSLLALNEQYSTIRLATGDTILNDRKLLESCSYIGFDCENCDDTAEEDPYLSAPKTLRKETVETASFDSEVTVEIYPYRMIASSFINNYAVYASAGSETYFKKRQRVWRGTSGMVWRWASFDPERNGIRAYCFESCGLTEYTNELACSEPESSSDLDTWGDTEDITERCDISFAFSISGSIGDDFTFYDISMHPTTQNVKLFSHGVVGMHYVRHNDNYFKAKTSKGFAPEVKRLLNTYRNFNYK